MIDQGKPSICEVLEASCENCAFESRRASEEPCVRCSEAYSSQFKSKPRFSEEEVVALGYICKCVAAKMDDRLERSDYNVLEIKHKNKAVVWLPCRLFPSLRPGQSILLEDILEGT